jgi:hypothetical protein|tara:strand:+ start:235 stop:372 length:138 start_codon:yes stop_codon:yes gene_type:complete
MYDESILGVMMLGFIAFGIMISMGFDGDLWCIGRRNDEWRHLLYC